MKGEGKEVSAVSAKYFLLAGLLQEMKIDF